MTETLPPSRPEAPSRPESVAQRDGGPGPVPAGNGEPGPADPAGGEGQAPGTDQPPGGRRGTAGLELLGGLAGAGIAGLVLLVMRSTLQVRTVPERVLEWMLLFVPLDVFEAGLRRFGFDAKRYALYGTILGALVLLAALGALALRRRWSVGALLGLGMGLWLLVMLVVMPLTSAGPFAVALVNGTTAAVGGYLVVALVYAGVLALFRERLAPPVSPPWIDRATAEQLPGWARRGSAHLLGGAVAAFGLTTFALRFGPRRRLPGVVVLDPQAPIPSGGIDFPNAHPNRTGSLPPPAGRPSGAANAPNGMEPPAPRQLARDKDGAALPSGRKAGQLAEPITSNADFYIVTKNAGGDPVLEVNEWRLRIDGEVGRPVELDYASLRRLPAVEVTKTLECISNFVSKCELAPFGCDLISTARWKGVRLSDVLALAGGARPGAASLATFGADEFTTSLPMEVALAPETLLVYEMNGQVLPREHGYPVRMLVPGRYGMKNAKWVVALRVMNREFVDWYGQRGWSRTAIVKTMSRIDVPAPGVTLAPGEHRIAGIAYGGDRGIAYVEFSADGGDTWEVGELLEQPASRDVWVRWQGTFLVQPEQDTITLMARATDGTGQTQPEPFSLPQPDGGAGWCAIDVKVSRA